MKKQIAPTMAALIEGEPRELTVSDKSTSMKLTAHVAVRINSNKEFANEMVNNLLCFFRPQPQPHTKGVVLQLVSTELDSSKILSLSLLFIHDS